MITRLCGYRIFWRFGRVAPGIPGNALSPCWGIEKNEGNCNSADGTFVRKTSTVKERSGRPLIADGHEIAQFYSEHLTAKRLIYDAGSTVSTRMLSPSAIPVTFTDFPARSLNSPWLSSL